MAGSRFIPYFASALRRDAAFVSDADKKALHRQAALWFATRTHLERAVSHAAQSGDFHMAEEIIGKAGGVDIFLRAGHQVLEHLIDNFPPRCAACFARIDGVLCGSAVETRKCHRRTRAAR